MIKTPEQVFKDGINGNINADFKWIEFIEPINGKPPLEILKNIQRVATVLSVYKHKLFDKQPVTITSGYRSPKHNADIGGAPNSYHCKGLAVDFTVKGFTIGQLYRLMDIHHFGGVEYPDEQNRLHIDLRGFICRFKGNGKVVAPHYNTLSHDKIFRK